MAKRIVPLTDLQVKNAKPGEKPSTLFDGGGLYLWIDRQKHDANKKPLPASKLWRLKYRFNGKEKLLSLGKYPDISLAEARNRRHEARNKIANGIDPSEVRKAQKAAQTEQETTFEVVAREWFNQKKSEWVETHAVMVMSRLEKYTFPVIGNRPISEIKAPEILKMIKAIEAQGTIETAYRTKVIIGQVFRYAVVTGRAQSDPTTALRGELASRKPKHHASITDPKDVAILLKAIDAYQGGFVVRQALRLAPLVFVRPGELRKAEWAEIDLENAEWNIPAEKMKMKQPHLVPLSQQAVEIIKELQQVTGGGKYLFPGRASKPMSENGVNAGLRYLGYDKDTMTGHGFRAMARTILDEVLQVRVDLIEHQLAHAVKDPLGRAYNRTTHLEARKEMMQQWADYLDILKAGNR
ncbi:MAG: integrase arm-type DNA-binding domain-containing protein [Geobacteraceae bacterium]|nr:integrase arm-type DNA-binding domain-containing protein [Geobacteraceae bacterium]